MNIELFNILLKERIQAIEDVLAAKRSEYASNQDVFANFKNATGISFHDSPEKVAWEYMVKHLQSIKDLITHVAIDEYNGYSSEKLIKEKLGDAINYLILIELMLLGRTRKPKI